MEGSGVVKRIYEPMGETLDAAVALWQSATMLDEAARIALNNSDLNSMILISDGWRAIGEHLLTPKDEEEDNEEEDNEDDNEVHEHEPIKIGFSTNGRVRPEDSDD
jgi:hypothetical protein